MSHTTVKPRSPGLMNKTLLIEEVRQLECGTVPAKKNGGLNMRVVEVVLKKMATNSRRARFDAKLLLACLSVALPFIAVLSAADKCPYDEYEIIGSVPLLSELAEAGHPRC